MGLETEDAHLFNEQMTELLQGGIDEGIENPMLDPADQMNLYFSKRTNLLVLDWKITNEGEITAIITTQLDAEDLEEMQEVNTRVNLEMREWREKRAKEKAERQAEAMEERRLIEVGRTAETYNLAGRVRELEAELAEMRKAARAP